MIDFYRFPHPIEQAIIIYRQHTSQLPEKIVVNPKCLSAARFAADTFAPSIEITTSAGCLLSEVWLNIPAKNGQKKNGQLNLLLENNMIINLQNYVEEHIPDLLDAGYAAYKEHGRGALFCHPQRDNGYGRASVKYFTEQMLSEDEDPALPTVQTYKPNSEVVFIVALDAPQDIITYVIDNDGARVILEAS